MDITHCTFIYHYYKSIGLLAEDCIETICTLNQWFKSQFSYIWKNTSYIL